MRKFYYIILAFFIIKNSTAQSIDTIYEQVYFDFDKYDLKPSEQNKLDAIALKGTLLQVYIEANTDARGSNDYNLKLGANRAKTVSDYLTTKAIQSDILKIINHGEARPIAFQEEETAFAKNRRVDIVIIYQEKIPEIVQTTTPKIDHPVILKDTNDIMDIYKELAIKPEVFIIKKQDTIIKSKRGTVLVIDKKDINCSCKKDAPAIRVELKEAYEKSEMIRERLVTMDNQNRLLESGGMLNLKIFCKNKPTWLSSNIEIIVPTDKYLDGMRLYNTINRTEKLTTSNGVLERQKMLWQPQKVLRTYDEWHRQGCGGSYRYPYVRLGFIAWCRFQIRNFRSFFRSGRQKRIEKKRKEKAAQKAEATLRKNNSINNTVKALKATKEAARLYVLETRQLGWMNLDRLRPQKGPLVQMKIEGKVEKSNDIMVVMEGFDAIYDPIYEKSPYQFSLEQGGKATVVALKFTDEGDFLMAFEKATSEETLVQLNFQKYSIDEIKEKLKQLDKG